MGRSDACCNQTEGNLTRIRPLADQKRTREQLAGQKQQADTLEDYARVARIRCEKGCTSYAEVLDAEWGFFCPELVCPETYSKPWSICTR